MHACLRAHARQDSVVDAWQLHDAGSMYSTTDKPEHIHRAKGGLEGSSGATGKMKEGKKK